MKITANQLRRIIKEEVRRIVEAPRGPAVDPQIRGYAKQIAKIVGQGRASDYLSVARVVHGFLNYEPDYWDDDRQEYSADPLELISDELGDMLLRSMIDSGGKLDFDGFKAAQEICDEFDL